MGELIVGAIIAFLGIIIGHVITIASQRGFTWKIREVDPDN